MKLNKYLKRTKLRKKEIKLLIEALKKVKNKSWRYF